MNILVLGASSILGHYLGKKFASNNILILVGQNAAKLSYIKTDLLKNGALEAIIVEQDLRKGMDRIFGVTDEYNIDLVINAASSTSPFMDSSIDPDEMLSYSMVDLITPVNIIEKLLADKKNNTNPLEVIFISSWVAGIKSPDRNIYSSFKLIQETVLKRIEDLNRSMMKLTIVKIGTRFSRETKSIHHEKISNKIFLEYKHKSTINYGISGRILTWIFYFSPLFMQLIIYCVRGLRCIKNFFTSRH